MAGTLEFCPGSCPCDPWLWGQTLRPCGAPRGPRGPSLRTERVPPAQAQNFPRRLTARTRANSTPTPALPAGEVPLQGRVGHCRAQAPVSQGDASARRGAGFAGGVWQFARA